MFGVQSKQFYLLLSYITCVYTGYANISAARIRLTHLCRTCSGMRCVVCCVVVSVRRFSLPSSALHGFTLRECSCVCAGSSLNVFVVWSLACACVCVCVEMWITHVRAVARVIRWFAGNRWTNNKCTFWIATRVLRVADEVKWLGMRTDAIFGEPW